jgi:hypothetical protein
MVLAKKVVLRPVFVKIAVFKNLQASHGERFANQEIV